VRLERELKKRVTYESEMAGYFSLRLSSHSWVKGHGYDSSHSFSKSHPVWSCSFELKQYTCVHLCNSGNFAFSGLPCVLTISGGQSCQMEMTFTPTTMANATATLVITETGLTSTIKIPLTGRWRKPHSECNIAFATQPLCQQPQYNDFHKWFRLHIFDTGLFAKQQHTSADGVDK
jgi:hypothetical protein